MIHTPGQTPGHVAYWHAEERVAITGDLLQDSDVAWIPFAGPWAEGALERTIASLERIAALDPVRTIPGHGPPVTDVPAAVAANLERYERFREDPSRAVWHAIRRATVTHLMIEPRSAVAGDAAVGADGGGRAEPRAARARPAAARRPSRARRGRRATAASTTPPSRTNHACSSRCRRRQRLQALRTVVPPSRSVSACASSRPVAIVVAICAIGAITLNPRTDSFV